MEKEPLPLKLTSAVIFDYPSASEILVSFPDEPRKNTTLCSCYATQPRKPRRDHFYGLSPEINLEMPTYRHYLFIVLARRWSSEQPAGLTCCFVTWPNRLLQFN